MQISIIGVQDGTCSGGERDTPPCVCIVYHCMATLYCRGLLRPGWSSIDGPDPVGGGSLVATV
jgi:hypothetical protein